MFTVEQESDHQKIVVMDDSGEFEDLELFVEEDGKVWLRQYDEIEDDYSLLIMNWHQLVDLCLSVESPAGFFKTTLFD